MRSPYSPLGILRQALAQPSLFVAFAISRSRFTSITPRLVSMF
ncbi:hypothetical protein COO91_03657 [Nostoc flagelliforme CCNUN1]|uniref:Uncharacterized protein n=1 Tax=Nostoc flagelliforme CCNUN1 TaxID=2038116 RepID=A0A2K8SQT2_9NOSO|nr:hypothetical protein COO91_03657 [Nostoc flagelliforme CCNUN1]